LGLFFRVGQGWFFLVTLCGKEGCVGFIVQEIGFVLHNTGQDFLVNWAKQAIWEAARVLKQIPPLRHAGSVPSVGMTGCTGGCGGFGLKTIGFDWVCFE